MASGPITEWLVPPAVAGTGIARTKTLAYDKPGRTVGQTDPLQMRHTFV